MDAGKIVPERRDKWMGMDGCTDGQKCENDKASGEPGAHNLLKLGCRINQQAVTAVNGEQLC